MSQVPLWFERKFDLTFPAEHFPYILVRLRGTPARLEEMLRPCGRESLIAKRESKWSAQEHAGHLLELEALWTARVEDYQSSEKELTAADLRNRGTDEANYNAQPLADILSRFRSARLALVNLTEKVAPDSFGRTLLHPRLRQPMRLVDHLYFVAEHDDHHLAHIWTLVQAAMK